MVELNSAVGILETGKKEERLEELIAQLSQSPDALGDYPKKLKFKDIKTDEFRPTGRAKGTMNVFARKLKIGRNWCTEGLDKFIDIFVTLKDNLEIKTLYGVLEQGVQDKHDKPPKQFVEKLTDSAAEARRGIIAYLKQSLGKPITDALKELSRI